MTFLCFLQMGTQFLSVRCVFCCLIVGCVHSAEGITYREWAPGAKVRVCSGFIQESCLRENLPMTAYSSLFGFCLILVFCAECVTHGRLQQLESNCKCVGKGTEFSSYYIPQLLLYVFGELVCSANCITMCKLAS